MRGEFPAQFLAENAVVPAVHEVDAQPQYQPAAQPRPVALTYDKDGIAK